MCVCVCVGRVKYSFFLISDFGGRALLLFYILRHAHTVLLRGGLGGGFAEGNDVNAIISDRVKVCVVINTAYGS